MTSTDDTVDDATKQESAFLAQFETVSHKVVRLTVGCLLSLLAISLIGACIKVPITIGYTSHQTSKRLERPDKPSNSVGTASITHCSKSGWLRTFISGAIWDCSGKVTWNAGPKRHEHFREKAFSREGDETGKVVSVVRALDRVGRGNALSRDSVMKNVKTETTSTGWFWPSLILGGIVTFFVAGVGLGRLIPYRSRLEIYDNERKKLRDRLLREGRLQPWDLPSWNQAGAGRGG